MNRAEKELLIECANFIGAHADGGNKATSLVARIDEVLKQDIEPEKVSVIDRSDTPDFFLPDSSLVTLNQATNRYEAI